MPDIENLAVYLHLARASELRRRLLVRDRLLVIAGALACEVGLPRIAALCRAKILEHNPAHLVRRWRDFVTAIGDSEFQQYHKQLARRFPAEKAEQMLQSLGIEWANERAAYFDDEEYAASIWGLTSGELDALFPPPDSSAE